MIDVQQVTKSYGALKAVDEISFTCHDGKVTGLLGPNGAGKTTALRIIGGLVRPNQGTVIVDEHDVVSDPNAVRAVIGMQGDSVGVYPRLTPREQFRYYGKLYGLKGDDLEQRIQTVIDTLDMADISERRAAGFSRGQRQKIILGRAFIHNPRNIIMDEPTNGLDVMAVRQTRDTIANLRDRGHAVLFSTHHLDEAERLCDDIAIIVKGKIVTQGSPQALMEATATSHLEDAFVELTGSSIDILKFGEAEDV